MSLPSAIKFYKDGEFVGSVACNCGWFWDGDLKALYLKEEKNFKWFVNYCDSKSLKGDNKKEFDIANSIFNEDSWDEMEAYCTRDTKENIF